MSRQSLSDEDTLKSRLLSWRSRRGEVKVLSFLRPSPPSLVTRHEPCHRSIAPRAARVLTGPRQPHRARSEGEVPGQGVGVPVVAAASGDLHRDLVSGLLASRAQYLAAGLLGVPARWNADIFVHPIGDHRRRLV